MRSIEIEEGLRLRFPGRDEEFDQGVEVGMVAILMTAIGGEFERRISPANLDQVRSLAERLGYHLVLSDSGDGSVQVLFRTGRARPRLTLIHSAPEGEPRPAPMASDGGSARRSAPTLVRRIGETAAVS